MASNLYRRPGSPYWWARIQVGGAEHRRSLRTTNRTEARKRLRDLLEQAGTTRLGLTPKDAATWQQGVERWATIHLPELREATAQRYRVSLRALGPHFEDRALEEIDRAAVAAFVAARRQGGATAATVRRDLDVLAMVLDNARDAGWIPDDRPNPANQARGRLVERREPIRPVPLRDLALALRRFPAGLAAMGRFLARTGCRQEEAASLEWRQVDLAAGTVTFAKTKTRSPRVIRLKPQALRDLKALREKGGGTYVFRSNAGDRHHNVASRWRMLVADALSKRDPRPPGFRCHDLRHTFAIRWLQQGGDIFALARHLGHASVKTTEIYLRWMVATK